MWGSASSKVAALAIRSCTSSSQRRRIAHVALVKIHVVFRQIAAIEQGARLAQIQIDVQIKLRRCRDFAKLRKSGIRRLPASQGVKQLSSTLQAVGNIYLLFDHPRG